MKKFSRLLERNNQSYKVEAIIELIVPAENEGEASYISDSTLSGIEYTSNYAINKIEKIDVVKEFLNYSNHFNIKDRVKNETSTDSSSKEMIKSELVGNQYQMVSGIIDILRKVKDIDNRMEIAYDMIEQFKRENIKFNYNNFLDSIK